MKTSVHSNLKSLNMVKVIKSRYNSKNALMVVGFPGIGNVSKLAASYIIDTLKLKKIYEIESDEFPFIVLIDENDIPKAPVWEIYGGKIKHDKFDFLYVFTGSFVVEDAKVNNLLIKELEKEFKNMNVKEIISFAGIATEAPRERIYVLSNNKTLTQEIKKTLNLDTTLFGFVSYISGMNGAFLKSTINTVCFLVETYAIPYYQGISETKMLIETINKAYQLDISTKDLEESIQRIKKEIEELTKAETNKREKSVNYIG